jgi:hypothetical protein
MLRLAPIVLAGLVVLALLVAALTAGGRARPSDPSRLRPRRGHRRAGTAFDDVPASAGATGAADAAMRDTQAATDFVTGAPIEPGAGTVRCEDCRALYHPDTAALLAEVNHGRCASCGGAALRRLDASERRRAAEAARRPRDARALVPEPAGAQAFAAAVGLVVAVRGTVVRTLGTSRDWPMLLMHADDGTAFRVVFVGDAARGRRGRALASELLGARVRLRGLLLRDEAHGLRLVLPDPSMILEVGA